MAGHGAMAGATCSPAPAGSPTTWTVGGAGYRMFEMQDGNSATNAIARSDIDTSRPVRFWKAKAFGAGPQEPATTYRVELDGRIWTAEAADGRIRIEPGERTPADAVLRTDLKMFNAMPTRPCVDRAGLTRISRTSDGWLVAWVLAPSCFYVVDLSPGADHPLPDSPIVGVSRRLADCIGGISGVTSRAGSASSRLVGGAVLTGKQQQVDSAVSYFQPVFDQMVHNIERVVYGKREAVRNALICMFADGHLLIEDVPGVAKTSLARAISDSILGARIRRVQFTPDLLPSDLVGVQFFDQIQQVFRFRPGPVFANVLVGDEINRATPKTQSALLEIMAERQVTVDGETHEAPQPFLCIATQNPVEHHGTFPLPEAQLDRFMMRIKVGYPSLEEEARIIATGGAKGSRAEVKKIVDIETMRLMAQTVTEVTVSSPVCRYIATLAAATRGEDGDRRGLRLGISPRGSLALAAAAQALAASLGRSYVTADDVRELAVPVLSHRLLLGHQAAGERRTQAAVIEELKRTIRPPGV